MRQRGYLVPSTLLPERGLRDRCGVRGFQPLARSNGNRIRLDEEQGTEGVSRFRDFLDSLGSAHDIDGIYA